MPLPAGENSCSSFPGTELAFLILLGFMCPIQNSPELDEEGYSIRPEEPGYILLLLALPLGLQTVRQAGVRSH